ncbi:MAG: protein phosphatase 2C domain-containing protein [Anaerolineales bacterium]|jgi:protein phosphatase
MEWLKRFLALFSRKEAAPEASIEEQPVEAPKAEIRVAASDSIIVGTAQSTGIERSHNEDALLILTGTAVGQETLPEFGLFVVADGMGGHRSGEVASAISVRSVAKDLTQQILLALLDLEDEIAVPPLQDLLREALEQANRAVVEQVPGGGTTLTVAVLLGHQVTIGHVGDSRAYIIANGTSEVITRDHSLVERLRELGQLTQEEAARHPQRNVLYRAIGQGANLEVDVVTHPAPNGGHMLLCSDGLWGVIGDESILDIVSNASNPQEACRQMVRAANAAGGPDNITAVLVQFPQKNHKE